MATHSSILAWKIQWTEGSGRLLTVHGATGVRHSLATKQETPPQFLYDIMLLLYNEVNQLCVYIYPLLLGPPSHSCHPSRSSESVKLSSLCYTAASHQVFNFSSVPFIHSVVSNSLLTPWTTATSQTSFPSPTPRAWSNS